MEIKIDDSETFILQDDSIALVDLQTPVWEAKYNKTKIVFNPNNRVNVYRSKVIDPMIEAEKIKILYSCS